MKNQRGIFRSTAAETEKWTSYNKTLKMIYIFIYISYFLFYGCSSPSQGNLLLRAHRSVLVNEKATVTEKLPSYGNRTYSIHAEPRSGILSVLLAGCMCVYGRKYYFVIYKFIIVYFFITPRRGPNNNNNSAEPLQLLQLRVACLYHNGMCNRP